MTTLLELLKLKEVVPFRSNKAVEQVVADPGLIYGVELETEEITKEIGDCLIPGMYGEPDGSLRNSSTGVAYEFISKPMSLSILTHVLTQFFTRNPFTEKNYSDRCSVHVHVNCQDLTVDQIQSVCLLYQAFEELFFAYANSKGGQRDKSIFCVPWSQTVITHNLIGLLSTEGAMRLKHWQKYTALNLTPLTTQGTIEFRHLPGTADYKYILVWCNLIGCLFSYARNNSLEDITSKLATLNTSSAYSNMADAVFKNWVDHIKFPGWEVMLENGVLDMKYTLISGKGYMKKSPNKKPVDWNFQGGAIIDEAEHIPAEVPVAPPPALPGVALRDYIQQYNDQFGTGANIYGQGIHNNLGQMQANAAAIPAIRRRAPVVE